MGRRYRARPPGQALPNLRAASLAPTPLGLRLAPQANRTDQPATGRSLRRSSGTRFSGAVRVSRSDWLKHQSRPLPMPFCFLPDLTRVKFGSTCPPLGGCYRAHQPGQALPNFQPVGLPQPPLPYGLRLREIGPINLPLADCSDGPLAPGFRDQGGRSEVRGFGPRQPGPFGLLPQRLLCPTVSSRI